MQSLCTIIYPSFGIIGQKRAYHSREVIANAQSNRRGYAAKPHMLTINDRNSAQLTGVREVLSFDEKQFLLGTEQGDLAVSGEGIHITALLLDEGRLTFEGRVDALSYSDAIGLRHVWRGWLK